MHWINFRIEPTLKNVFYKHFIECLFFYFSAFASRVASEREKEVFNHIGKHTFFLPIGSDDGMSSSKLQEIDTWVSQTFLSLIVKAFIFHNI